MKDIELAQKCGHCGSGLTLMESISVRENQASQRWLVKRCLKCGSHPVEEVVRLPWEFSSSTELIRETEAHFAELTQPVDGANPKPWLDWRSFYIGYGDARLKDWQ